MFPKYREVNELFYDKYGDYLKRYPYAFFVLEKILRMEIVGKKNLVKRDLKYYSEFSKRKFLVRSLQKLYLFCLFSFYKKSSVLVNLPKFSDVSKVIEDSFLSNNWRYLQTSSVTNYFCAAVCTGNRELSALFKKYLVTNGDNILNEVLLLKLNSAVKKEVVHFSQLFIRLKIKFLFVQGDSSPSERVICEAAKLAKCRVIVLAHGYVQSPSLITIAPVYADQLCVWTEQQREDLKSVVENASAIKIRYCGSLFLKRDRKLNSSRLSALIALEVLPVERESQKRYMNVLTNYLEAMREKSFAVKIRPHPKEKSETVDQIIEVFPNAYLSLCETALEAIYNSDLVLAPNSSMLIQAREVGKISFQISELKTFSFEGIASVNSRNFLTKYNSLTELQSQSNTGKTNFFNVVECLAE